MENFDVFTRIFAPKMFLWLEWLDETVGTEEKVCLPGKVIYNGKKSQTFVTYCLRL